MSITIDTTIDFRLPHGRSLSLDVLDLEDFIASLWETKATPPPQDAAGNPMKGPNDQPLPAMLDWPVIQAEVAAFVKKDTGIDIKKSEAMAIWGAVTTREEIGKDEHGHSILGKNVLEKKRQSWLAPAPEPQSSPNSPPSTDPRLLED